jgi:hypothetical protein
MDKIDCYKYLYEIHNSDRVDITEQVRKIAGIGHSVPESVIKFINKYIPQPQLATYNVIYEKRHKNPLYKSLVNEDLPVEDRAVSLASFLTQAMIGIKTIKDSEIRENYYREMLIDSITEAMKEYSLFNKSDKLNEAFCNVRNKFKSLYGE